MKSLICVILHSEKLGDAYAVQNLHNEIDNTTKMTFIVEKQNKEFMKINLIGQQTNEHLVLVFRGEAEIKQYVSQPTTIIISTVTVLTMQLQWIIT